MGETMDYFLQGMKKEDKRNLAIIVGMIVAIFVFWSIFYFKSNVKAPESIDISVGYGIKNGEFYSNEIRDGIEYITVQDKIYTSYTSTNSELIDIGDTIDFSVSPVEARQDVKWELEITNDGKTRTVERNSVPAGIEYHFFTGNFSLGLGENEITIHVKTRGGEISRKIIVNKLRVEDECVKSENAEKKICKVYNGTNKESSGSSSSSGSSGNSSGSSSSGSSGSSGSSSSKCSHYEYGKCWDELEDRAYSDGYLDGGYGNGHSYYDPDCTGVCEDIYEDAYYEGYYDGRNGY